MARATIGPAPTKSRGGGGSSSNNNTSKRFQEFRDGSFVSGNTYFDKQGNVIGNLQTTRAGAAREQQRVQQQAQQKKDVQIQRTSQVEENKQRQQEIAAKKFQGPTRPSTDVQTFRETGSVKKTDYYQKKIIDTRGGVPTTAYFKVDTKGNTVRVSKADETELRKQEAQGRSLKISNEKKTIVSKGKDIVLNAYDNFNEKLKEGITQPIGRGVSYVSGKAGGPTTFKEAQQNIRESTLYLQGGRYPKGVAKAGEFVAGAGLAITKDIYEKPAKNLLIAGVGAGAGFALKVGATGAAAVGTRTAAAFSLAEAGGSLAIGSYAVKELDTQIASKPTAIEKGGVVGVAAKDLALFGVGGIAGQRGANKAIDIIRTRGRVELPVGDFGLIKELTPVIKQTDRFVESKHFGGTNTGGAAKQAFDLKVFKRAGRVYQASPQSFSAKEVVVTKGSSEFPGLYGAPNPSVYFLKAGGETPLKAFGGFSSSASPTLSLIKTAKFTTKQTRDLGTGFVTGVKPEIEAVLPVGTRLQRTGRSTFFELNKRKIPVDEFTAINELAPKTSSGPKSFSAAKEISGSSSLGKSFSVSLINPSSVLSGVFSSSGSRGSSVGSLKSYFSSGLSSPKGSSGSSIGPSKSSLSALSYRPSSYKSYKSSSGKSSSSPYSYGGSSRGGLPSYSPPKTKISVAIRFPKAKGKKKKGDLFKVFLGKGTEFKPIGTTANLDRAVSVGASKSLRTSATKFLVRGPKALNVRTPKGFFKSPKVAGLFIEKGKRGGKKKKKNFFEF